MKKKLRCLDKVPIYEDFDPKYGDVAIIRCDLERKHQGKHVADRDGENYHCQIIWYDQAYEKEGK